MAVWAKLQRGEFLPVGLVIQCILLLLDVDKDVEDESWSHQLVGVVPAGTMIDTVTVHCSSYCSGESRMQCAMVCLLEPMQLPVFVVARSNLLLFRSHPQHTP